MRRRGDASTMASRCGRRPWTDFLAELAAHPPLQARSAVRRSDAVAGCCHSAASAERTARDMAERLTARSSSSSLIVCSPER